MTDLILYSTPDCHLCEQAERLLAAIGRRALAVDIAADGQLLERYGVRIPVLRRADGGELDWPFGERDIIAFLQARRHGGRL